VSAWARVGPERSVAGRLEARAGATTAVLVGVAALVVGVNAWGRALQAAGERLYLNLPPLVGHLALEAGPWTVAAAAVGALAIAVAVPLAARLRWSVLLVAASLTAAAWSIALALTEGLDGLVRSPASQRDYLAVVPRMGSPGAFLATLVERLPTYPTHVRAHPPGMALIAWVVDRAGGAAPAMAVLEIAVAASGVAAVLLAVRELGGPERARDVAPFVVFAPFAITIASSGDALFLGTGAWAVAATVLATGRRGPRAVALAATGGLLLGACAFLSYGLVLLTGVAGAAVIVRRRLALAIPVVLGVAGVAVAFAIAGVSWLDGLAATRVEYARSVARLRPYGYFVVANLAAFAVVLGPAAIAGIVRAARRSPVWPLVAGALAAIAVADVSGLSKGEVERIWLPFAPWLVVATCELPARSRRRWLALTVAFGLGLELLVAQPW
jgi:hypothetical protein